MSLPGAPPMLAVNLLRVVRCIDEDGSSFTKWTKDDHRADLAGQYRQVGKLVLDERSIPDDAHLFRIDGWKVQRIASRAVKEVMESEGARGAKLTGVETTSRRL